MLLSPLCLGGQELVPDDEIQLPGAAGTSPPHSPSCRDAGPSIEPAAHTVTQASQEMLETQHSAATASSARQRDGAGLYSLHLF